MTLQNEKFEELIADQLAATLDSQRGKASAAFKAQLAAEAMVAEKQAETPKAIPISRGLQGQVSRRALWFWTAIPSLAAACLAVVVMVQLGVLGRKPVMPTDNPASVASGNPNKNAAIPGGVVASSVEVTQNQPGAVTVNNNTPVREIRQTTLRQTQWVDPTDHAVYTVTEPGEKVDYVQVQPF